MYIFAYISEVMLKGKVLTCYRGLKILVRISHLRLISAAPSRLGVRAVSGDSGGRGAVWAAVVTLLCDLVL